MGSYECEQNMSYDSSTPAGIRIITTKCLKFEGSNSTQSRSEQRIDAELFLIINRDD